MLEVEVTETNIYEKPSEWAVKDWNAGGAVVGTVRSDGSANAVYVHMNRPFSFAFDGGSVQDSRIGDPTAENGTDTTVEVDKRGVVVIRSEWKWLDVIAD